MSTDKDHRWCEEAGFGLIEVLVAAMIVLVGVLGSMLALDSSGRATHHAQRNQQAGAIAEREIERIKAVPYAQLGLAAPLPAHSTAGARDPDSWVVDGVQPLFELPEAYRDPASAAVRPAEPLIGGGTVVSGPTSTAPGGTSQWPARFDAGGTTGTIHRYVSWRDEDCSVLGLIDLCGGTEDTKRITVAIVLDVGAGGFRPKPVWLSTVVTDPGLEPLSVSDALPESNPGSGLAITEQPFFLYDTPCSEDIRLPILSDHLLRDTTGSSCLLGGTLGAITAPPDLMGPEAPEAPLDGSIPPRYDFASDITTSLLGNRSNPVGGVLQRATTGATTDCPTDGNPSTVHQWSTAPFVGEFRTPNANAHTVFNFVTRTLDAQPGAVTVCARLYAAGALEQRLLADGELTMAEWPTEPTALEFELGHAGFSVAAGDRLVVSLSLKGSASTRDIELRYDHPGDRTFVSIATTTPLE